MFLLLQINKTAVAVLAGCLGLAAVQRVVAFAFMVADILFGAAQAARLHSPVPHAPMPLVAVLLFGLPIAPPRSARRLPLLLL